MRRLESRITAADFDTGGVDGRFGAKTEAVVKELQEQAALEIDGIVGPATWEVVNTFPAGGERAVGVRPRRAGKNCITERVSSFGGKVVPASAYVRASDGTKSPLCGEKVPMTLARALEHTPPRRTHLLSDAVNDVARISRRVPDHRGGYVRHMGRESASYYLTLPAELEDAVLVALREGGAEAIGAEHTWIELRLRDPHRYWIDLRVHRAPEPLLEIRIALTNDEWSIRAPLEAAFTALPAGAAQRPLRDEDGGELGAPAQDGWSLRARGGLRAPAGGVRRAASATSTRRSPPTTSTCTSTRPACAATTTSSSNGRASAR